MSVSTIITEVKRVSMTAGTAGKDEYMRVETEIGVKFNVYSTDPGYKKFLDGFILHIEVKELYSFIKQEKGTEGKNDWGKATAYPNFSKPRIVKIERPVVVHDSLDELPTLQMPAIRTYTNTGTGAGSNMDEVLV